MYSFPVLRPGILFAIFLLYCSMGLAQETPGTEVKIYRIADSSGPKKILIEGETDKVQLQRGEGAGWQAASPGLDLLVGDRLKLDPYIHVDLRIQGNQEGQLVLLPGIVDRGGIFRLEDDPDVEGSVQIALESGAMSVDWFRQKLTVIAFGIRTLISGTKVSFLRDPENNKRIAFLDHGTVTFPDYESVVLEDGDIAILEFGQAPVAEKISLQKQAWLRGIIRYNAEDVWKGSPVPFYRSPLFYVPAAAVLVGGGIYLIIDNNKESALPEPPPLPK